MSLLYRVSLDDVADPSNVTAMHCAIELAPGAENNGLAGMLADLVRQNLDAKPHKRADLLAIGAASVSLVADDADVALTLEFDRGRLTIHDGIRAIPDVTIRASSETILAMSNMPLTRRLGLPIPGRADEEGKQLVRSVFRALRTGDLKIYGGFFRLGLMTHLTRVMSVNG
jgi:hypothetical protein